MPNSSVAPLRVPAYFDPSIQYLVPSDFQYIGELSDQVYRLSAILMEMTANRQDRRDGEMFPFGSDLYRLHFGGEGSKVVGWAEEIGLVERSTYIKGKQSKLIRLTDRYRDGRFRIVEICRKSRSKAKAIGSTETLVGVCSWLAGHLSRFRLPESPQCANAWDGYLAYCFATGRFRASRDSIGRFHSSLTGMSRVLRSQLFLPPTGSELQINVQHIEREGSAHPVSIGFPSSCAQRALVQIDVKTCQPLLIGAAAFNETIRPGADIYEWLEICQGGDLYDYMRIETGSALDRDQIKKEVMVATFGTNEQALRTAVGRLLRKRFPSIWSFISELKKTDHRDAARFAQGQEARLIIDGACRSLMLSHPDIPIATVHDAVICPLFHVQNVSDAIRAAFRVHGVLPQMTATPNSEITK